MSLLDSGTRSYPFIIGLDHLLKVGVRKNAFRIRVPHPNDARIIHSSQSSKDPLLRFLDVYYFAAFVGAGF